jgi:3-carboxy-cis,cis-muconate cycloisomerase
MPHKRNPSEAAISRACARRVRAAAGVLLEAMEQEHERAAGGWHSEWEPLREALALTGGAAHSLREALDGLDVRPEHMRRSLELTGGLLMAESVTTAMAGQVGRDEAKRIVEAACRRAVDSGKPLRDELVGDDVVSEVLGADGVDQALDPGGYLGSAEAFVDRALDRYGEDRT